MIRLRFLCFALGLFVFGNTLWAQTSPETRPHPLSEALQLGRAGNWDAALETARSGGDLAVDIVQWHRLRASAGRFQETIAFLNKRPDWPGLPYLRRQSEFSLNENTPVTAILTYFSTVQPGTARGSLRLAQAQKALGRHADAIAEARRGWVSFSFSQDLQDELLRDFGTDLTPVHETRLRRLLWEEQGVEAGRMLHLVSDDLALFAQARMALQAQASSAVERMAAVPHALLADSGLVFDRFALSYRLNRSAARKLMLLQSTSAEKLGQPEKWATFRIDMARADIRDGQGERAYRLASNHFLEPGQDYAELEWISGYAALTLLNRPDLALFHFQRHGMAVESPISLARSSYWQGRAFEGIGAADAAVISFKNAARHQTTFYGLLAADKLDLPMDSALIGAQEFPNWRNAAFVSSSVFQAAEMLDEAGETRLAVRFLTHLAEGLNRFEIGQLASMAQEKNQAYHQVMIAKRGVKYGKLIEGPYFPLHPVAQNSFGVPGELALAISRRESEFFPAARSGVGALGLMQLMPDTAQEMAGDLGLDYSVTRTATDPEYNATLGNAYLQELLESFGNSPIQIAAAYNAGPSRAWRWLKEFGDPRDGEIDVVDWIEMIPFDETRNYVMRVSESLPVYRARLSGKTEPIDFHREITGNYVAPPPPLAPTVSKRPQLRPVELEVITPIDEDVPATE